MEFIVENWYMIIVAIAIVMAIAMAVIKFFKGNTEEQLNKIREWLLYATALAEKELGDGTGKLKLRFVYDMFATKFPWMVKIISFERFSSLVDEVLGDMNDLLTTNTAVQHYINGSTEAES